MTDRDRLEACFQAGDVKEEDLAFGRVMPFGKHKGKYIYHLLVKHHLYMDWVLANTRFTLTGTETWWKEKIDTAVTIAEANRLISGLGFYVTRVCKMPLNIENPHSVVE